ncbi:MAG: flagellar biosynthetic protein FliQ [Vampirovibrionales bacterium]|nr:flagellar biosynthetic protein FliQ [Vampirovibrionales bacterium]
MIELLIEHLKNGIILSLLISIPVVLAAASVGLVIGILQAVTQVQEQTIPAAPKIIIVFSVVILGGTVMMTMLTNYLMESFTVAFNEVPAAAGPFVLEN